jgi:hypothetical protein
MYQTLQRFASTNCQAINFFQMKQVVAIVGLLFLSMLSCKKDSSSDALSGLYTEESPVAGRSQLRFISDKMVIKSEAGSNFKDTFTYSITTGKILLTPTWTNQYSSQQFDFERIDNVSFKIENLYPGIPEAQKSYMIFKKQ